MRFLPVKSRHTTRCQDGSQLVELLVAVLVSSIMAGALVSMMGQSYQVTTQAQNQVIAASICQQVIDACRNTDFAKLSSPASQGGCIGTGQQLVIKDSGGSQFPAVFPRPLLMSLNDSNMQWDQKGYQYGGRRRSVEGGFRGTATADVSLVDADNVQVTVTVAWPQGAGTRTHRSTARISRFGISRK